MQLLLGQGPANWWLPTSRACFVPYNKSKHNHDLNFMAGFKSRFFIWKYVSFKKASYESPMRVLLQFCIGFRMHSFMHCCCRVSKWERSKVHRRSVLRWGFDKHKTSIYKEVFKVISFDWMKSRLSLFKTFFNSTDTRAVLSSYYKHLEWSLKIGMETENLT